MTSPIERSASAFIGTVDSVSPSEIRVVLDVDAPQSVALNTAALTAFPKINSYLIVPTPAGLLAGLITWVGIERSSFPKRSGLRDFGLIDLPFPLRRLTLSPVGTLTVAGSPLDVNRTIKLERGVAAFPSVGDPVYLPTQEHIQALVEGDTQNPRVWIGSAPIGEESPIHIDPDRLFGRHVAVLGNTGSGKSCTVAGMIRWSLEGSEPVGAPPNARFIVLDPNGEYRDCFEGVPGGVRVFQLGSENDAENPFVVPAWMWNSHEWAAFTEAAPRVQRPLLIRALRELKSGIPVQGDSAEQRARRRLRLFKYNILEIVASGKFQSFPDTRNVGLRLEAMVTDVDSVIGDCEEELAGLLTNLREQISEILDRRGEKYADKATGALRVSYQAFSVAELEQVSQFMSEIIGEDYVSPPSDAIEDLPVPFDVDELASHLSGLADLTLGTNSTMVDTLVMRIQGLMTDSRKRSVLVPDTPPTLADWLETFLGDPKSGGPAVCVIDLSLIPFDVLHTSIAAFCRMLFEALQRFHRANADHRGVPTVLVLEEAHAFVRRSAEHDEGLAVAADVCREVFERISREGRKFGMGLVLSSQRPSELSPTVLSQCNSFIVHRVVNDRDQDLLGRLAPDNVAGLLRELPSLASRQAVGLGWAFPIPQLMTIRALPESQRPSSADVQFWDVWSRVQDISVDWQAVAESWSPANPAPVEPEDIYQSSGDSVD